MLSVCFVCEEYPPAPHGGTGSSYRDLAEGLVGAGHRVTVVGVHAPKKYDVGAGREEVLNGVRVIRMPAAAGWWRYRLGALLDRRRVRRKLEELHRHEPLSVVEASDYAGWLRFGAPAGVPSIVRIRGSNIFFDTVLQRAGGNAFEHGMERRALANARFIASVSRYAAEQTLAICGLSGRACTVLPNAVDMAVFSPDPQVPVEPGLIVFVNSVNPKKGIEQLLEAMNLIAAEHPAARLVVIGQDTQKPQGGQTYVERLQQRLKPEVRPRVQFLGRLDRNKGVLEYLRRAQICCYPSHMETFGIAAIEAMSVGKATIFSRTGPGPEVVVDGESGLLCDPYDAGDIAAKLRQLLGSPEFCQQLGQKARERVKTHFDKRDWVRRNVDYFNVCCEEMRTIKS
jgi:glycosyltransferase involved in cell wall biosynthesis